MKSSYARKIKNSTILITGGTGSFGNTVVKQLLAVKPKKIIIFSRDELKQFEMREKFDNALLKFVIGDVRDFASINRAMEGVDYVFHAAALKQVPTAEFFPVEAVKTNVLGAQNVMEAARKNGVKRVVVLSTDKSVYPINAMGMSKALMEKTMIAEARNQMEIGKRNTVFCGVRYGNVLYTRGSILPYFVESMKNNKKLPVTNLSMTRFLLPLSHAVDLVFHALVEGKNGYIYVRKSPASTIETLAKAFCRIFNYKIGYEEVGVRAGEKSHETLIAYEEFARTIESGNYYEIPPESQGLDYNKYFTGVKKKARIGTYTSENTQRLNVEQTIELLEKVSGIREEIQNFKKRQKKTSKRI